MQDGEPRFQLHLSWDFLQLYEEDNEIPMIFELVSPFTMKRLFAALELEYSRPSDWLARSPKRVASFWEQRNRGGISFPLVD